MRYRMLTRNNDFSRAYARGASYVHPCLVLYVNKNRCGRVRIGLTATKKVGNAVRRNRARRVMRAALDSVLPLELLQAQGKGKGLDLVLVARGVTARKKSYEIAAVLAKLCRQAGVACNTPQFASQEKASAAGRDEAQAPQQMPQDATQTAQGHGSGADVSACANSAQTPPVRP